MLTLPVCLSIITQASAQLKEAEVERERETDFVVATRKPVMCQKHSFPGERRDMINVHHMMYAYGNGTICSMLKLYVLHTSHRSCLAMFMKMLYVLLFHRMDLESQF